MTSPEDALAAARESAAGLREELAALDGFRAEPVDAPDSRLLRTWAVIAPDAQVVRSTRRLGRPVTAAKRGLVRALAQYMTELTAQQTRFNLVLLARVDALEERIAALEEARP